MQTKGAFFMSNAACQAQLTSALNSNRMPALCNASIIAWLLRDEIRPEQDCFELMTGQVTLFSENVRPNLTGYSSLTTAVQYLQIY